MKINKEVLMKKHETEAGPAARQGQRIGRSSLDEVFNTVDTLKAELQITKSIAIQPGGSSLQLLAYSVRWEVKDGALVRDEMKCRPHYAITRSAYLRGKAAALGMIFDRVDLDGIERIAEYMTNPTDES